MIVFLHLRKCAGSSVVRAAAEAGMVLPAGHVNGHPPGPDGHALAGLSRLSPAELGRFMAGLAQGGVEFTALEWDVPRLSRFPAQPPLDFFTIFRDPVERFLSNYAYDVTSRYTASRSPWDYLRGPGLWQSSNYFTRFFCGLSASDAVGSDAVDEAAAIIGDRVRWARFGEDLHGFLRDEVGMPVGTLKRANRTNAMLRLLHRSQLNVSDADRAELRRLNEADYALLAAIGSAVDGGRIRTPGGGLPDDEAVTRRREGLQATRLAWTRQAEPDGPLHQ